MPHVDFWLAVLAGFIAGYVMALAALWGEGLFGLPRIDFGHTGVVYLAGEKAGWWVVGIVFHLIDSMLLGLLYAAAVYPSFPWLGVPQGAVVPGAAVGMVYGVAIWAVLAMTVVTTLMGSGPFAWRTGSPRPALASLALHLIYGAILGGVYVP